MTRDRIGSWLAVGMLALASIQCSGSVADGDGNDSGDGDEPSDDGTGGEASPAPSFESSACFEIMPGAEGACIEYCESEGAACVNGCFINGNTEHSTAMYNSLEDCEQGIPALLSHCGVDDFDGAASIFAATHARCCCE